MSERDRRRLGLYALALAVVIAVWVMAELYPIGSDYLIFHSASVTDPHATQGYVSPPWMIFLLPHRLLPVKCANAVNGLLNIAVVLLVIGKLGSTRSAVFLTFTCPVFYELVRANNVDWLPLLGLVVGIANPYLGTVLMSCKPQVLGAAVLVWAKRDGVIALVPLLLLSASLVVWGRWWGRLTYNPVASGYNLAVLPISIPYGLWLLKKAWDEDDPILAAVSTPLLTPYISPSSLAAVFAVVAAKYPKAARWLWLGIWAWTITMYRRWWA